MRVDRKSELWRRAYQKTLDKLPIGYEGSQGDLNLQADAEYRSMLANNLKGRPVKGRKVKKVSEGYAGTRYEVTYTENGEEHFTVVTAKSNEEAEKKAKKPGRKIMSSRSTGTDVQENKSYLKDIIVELHNCLHEFEPEDEIPMVWSREFQQQLALNATHWNDDQRRASHVGDMDFQDDQDADIFIAYSDTDETAPGALDGELEFDYEEEELSPKHFKTKWGSAYRKWLFSDDSETEEEERMSFNLPKRGAPSEDADDCPDCFGTGMDFPRLKGECSTCGGSRKAVKAEEEEGLNITDDPDKVAKAKKLRDRARQARDQARSKRDEAKEKNAKEKGGDVEGDMDNFGQEDNLDQEGKGDEEWDNPDLQGVIRTIPNAHLVYKRQQEDGTFDELWIYNVDQDYKKELKVRRAILAGTDIPINKMKSPDGSQTYELWTVGNAQMLKVRGLPN